MRQDAVLASWRPHIEHRVRGQWIRRYVAHRVNIFLDVIEHVVQRLRDIGTGIDYVIDLEPIIRFDIPFQLRRIPA